LALAFLSFAIGVYSWDYLKRFVSALRKELIIATVLTIITYILLMQFQALWYFFSYNVTMILYWLFTPLFPTYLEVGQTPIIDVNGFVVSIGPPCSGTESMFLFMVFSIGLYLLDKEKIKTRLFIIVSVIGLIGVYFVNILRLFLLILTGIYVNPDFAVGMFHTNIGWLLFVVYFLVYYYIMRKFIYKHNISKR
jgi:exosortase/archaeosortase family protein